MKKIISITILIFTLLIIMNLATGGVFALADWWQRPDTLPTQPSIPRDIVLPTAPLQPTTSPQPSAAPTIAPTNPPTGGTSPSDPGESESGRGGNSCDPGKSYVGPYCGWSPSVGNNGGGGGQTQSRVGGPQVLGLSNTSSSDVVLSDIILLAGVLCLALYARSKLILDNSTI